MQHRLGTACLGIEHGGFEQVRLSWLSETMAIFIVFGIQDSGFRIRDSGFGIRDSGVVTGFRIPVPESRIQF